MSKLIYFIKPIGLDGPVKIGCSKQPEDRLLTLGVWSPLPLELIGVVPGTFNDEQFLHQCFSGNHSHREWFHSTPILQNTIKTILNTGSVRSVRGHLIPQGKIRSINGNYAQSPNAKLRNSYNLRVVWAQKKLRSQGELNPWYPPSDIKLIMEEWQPKSAPPSADKILRLDEYLKNPRVHSVYPPWRDEYDDESAEDCAA